MQVAEGRDCPCGSVGMVFVLSKIRHFAVGIMACDWRRTSYDWHFVVLDQGLGERE